MKFLITKDLNSNPLLKLLIFFVSSILLFFLISDIVLHHYQIGLTVQKATETILGNEDAFVDPIFFDILLERVHIDILISLLTLLIISSVCISIAKKNRFKGILINFSFIFAILSHISLLFGFYYGEVFIISWIFLFTAWHIFAIMMTTSIGIRVLFLIKE